MRLRTYTWAKSERREAEREQGRRETKKAGPEDDPSINSRMFLQQMVIL